MLLDANDFPCLQTERLILGRLTVEDASAVFAFRSDPEVQRYNGGALTRIEEAADLIILFESGFRERTRIEWGITLRGADETVIGDFGYAHWSPSHRRAEIGYCLARGHWRQGIASEALRAIVAFGFQSMELNRIHACPWCENVASVRLLERNGFQQEGVRREEFWDGGAFHDEALYALLRREYRPSLG